MKKFLGAVLMLSVVLLGTQRVEAKYGDVDASYSVQEAENSVGNFYSQTQFNTGLTTGASTWILIDLTTATKNMYLDYEAFSSTGTFNVAIRYNPVVVSSGTEIAGNNFNRAILSTSSLKLHGDSGVISSVGTVIDSAHGKGSLLKNKVPITLRKGFDYLAEVVNKSSSTTTCEIRLYWYEK